MEVVSTAPSLHDVGDGSVVASSNQSAALWNPGWLVTWQEEKAVTPEDEQEALPLGPPLVVTPHSSISSSNSQSPPSPSSHVSDSSDSSSCASASGDHLRKKKNRKYREKKKANRPRSQLLEEPPKSDRDHRTGSLSPSANYCQEWIFSKASVPEKRITFAETPATEIDNQDDEEEDLSPAVSTDDKKEKKDGGHAWLLTLQKFFKIKRQPSTNKSPSSGAALASISEATDRSETPTPASTPSSNRVAHIRPSPPSPSSSSSTISSACHTPTNTTTALEVTGRMRTVFFSFDFSFLFYNLVQSGGLAVVFNEISFLFSNLKKRCLIFHFCFSLVSLQYELKEMKRRQEEEERIRADEMAAQQAALSSLHSPPDGSRHDQYETLNIFLSSFSTMTHFSLV